MRWWWSTNKMPWTGRMGMAVTDKGCCVNCFFYSNWCFLFFLLLGSLEVKARNNWTTVCHLHIAQQQSAPSSAMSIATTHNQAIIISFRFSFLCFLIHYSFLFPSFSFSAQLAIVGQSTVNCIRFWLIFINIACFKQEWYCNNRNVCSEKENAAKICKIYKVYVWNLMKYVFSKNNKW